MPMYNEGDSKRLFNDDLDITESKEDNPERTDWRIDYARLILSPSFRRLIGKTQLFPDIESDFFRNRITHSLEVAQIGKSIAQKINFKEDLTNENGLAINLDIVEIAGLAHDLGHPPFGHTGEEALDECMKDFGGFEGNAQTFRILTKLEKKILNDNDTTIGIDLNGDDRRYGLNLTSRVLASVLKYCYTLGSKTTRKGFYDFDKELVGNIIQNIVPAENISSLENQINNGFDFKTVECSIMDCADDIAYATFDFEDSLKADFINPFDLIYPDEKILHKVTLKLKNKFPEIEKYTVKNELRKLFEHCKIDVLPPIEKGFVVVDGQQIEKEIITEDSIEVIHKNARILSTNNHFRSKLTSSIVNYFINNVRLNRENIIPALWFVEFEAEAKLQVEVLKQFVFITLTQSPRLKIVDFRGKKIVKKIFDILSGNDEKGGKVGNELLPRDFQEIYDIYDIQYIKYKKDLEIEEKEEIKKELEVKLNEAKLNQKRIICDFISGMTNRYAIEFYERIISGQPVTIFKEY